MTETKKTKTTKTKTGRNKGRTVARFEQDGKKLTITLNGLSLSAFVVEGEDRKRGKPTRFATAEEAQAGFEQATAKAVASGWDSLRKTFSIEDLIG